MRAIWQSQIQTQAPLPIVEPDSDLQVVMRKTPAVKESWEFA